MSTRDDAAYIREHSAAIEEAIGAAITQTVKERAPDPIARIAELLGSQASIGTAGGEFEEPVQDGEIEELLNGKEVNVILTSLTMNSFNVTLTRNDTGKTLLDGINDRTGQPVDQMRLFCEVPVGLEGAFGACQFTHKALSAAYTGSMPEAIKMRPLVLLDSSTTLASLVSVGLTRAKRAAACSQVVRGGLKCWYVSVFRKARPDDIPDDVIDKCGSSTQKRLLKEWKDMKAAERDNFKLVDPERISAEPKGEERPDIARWTVMIMGPPDTPYAKGKFCATLVFPSNYPFAPPLFRFTTKVYHCNVNVDGVVYLPLLIGKTDEGGEWSPGHVVPAVLNAVYTMMSTPEPGCAARFDIVEQLIEDKSAHDATAAEWTDKFAVPHD